MKSVEKVHEAAETDRDVDQQSQRGSEKESRSQTRTVWGAHTPFGEDALEV